MNLNHIKYTLLNIIRDPSYSFWTLVYPLILASFFYMGMASLINDTKPLTMTVGIETGSPARLPLATIDGVTLKETDLASASEIIKADKMVGFVDKDLNVTVGKTGVKETILVSVAEQFKEMQAMNIPLQNYDFTADYVEEKNLASNPFLIPFLTLIGMTSIYSMFSAVEYTALVQADQTFLAQRLNVIPVKKGQVLLSGVITALATNFVSNLLLLAFLQFVLKIQVVKNPLLTLALILAGNIFGVALGLAFGTSNKLSLQAKSGLAVGISLVLSFLSGMMSPDIKNLIDMKIPLLNKLNPIALITTELVRVNQLADQGSLWTSIGIILALSGVLFLFALIFLRRKSYDQL